MCEIGIVIGVVNRFVSLLIECTHIPCQTQHTLFLSAAFVTTMYMTVICCTRANTLPLDPNASSWTQSFSPTYYAIPQMSYEDQTSISDPNSAKSVFSRLSLLAFTQISNLHAQIGLYMLAVVLIITDFLLVHLMTVLVSRMSCLARVRHPSLSL
jgi:hypothetical protein